jgi:hypothetical protein
MSPLLHMIFNFLLNYVLLFSPACGVLKLFFLMTTRWCVSATCGIFLWAAWSRRPKPQNRARSFVSGLPFGSQPVYWVGDRGRRRGARAPGMMLPSAPESPHELEPFTILHHFHIEYHNSFSLIHMLQMLFTDNINTNGCLTTHATRRVVSVAVATDPPPGRCFRCRARSSIRARSWNPSSCTGPGASNGLDANRRSAS